MRIDVDRLIRRFLRYVQCDSESRQEQGFCQLLEEELQGLGLEVWRDEIGPAIGSNGWNIGARFRGEGSALLLCCHLDTISPGRGIKPCMEGGVILSDGSTILAADDKAGIAAIMEALETAAASPRPHRTVEILFTICEEIGLLGSKNADYSRFTAKEALVLDSSMAGCVVNKAPAHGVMHFSIKGKSSHAGIAPQKGVHALKAAAEAIYNIPCGQADENTRVNVANFLSPGKANVIPEEAAFDAEVRCFEDAMLQVHMDAISSAVADACRHYGAAYCEERTIHNCALHVPDDSPLLQRVLEVSERIGRPVKAAPTYGGSDASNLAGQGIQAVNICTGMQNVHSVRESIAVQDMAATSRFVYEMIGME